MSTIRKSAFIALIILWLTSCSMLSPVKTEPQTTYVINSIPRVSSLHGGSDKTLMIGAVGSEPVYNTVQMAYSKHSYQIAYFAKNRWAARPADMLQPLIVQTLQNTHYYHAVVGSATIAQADYLLSTQLLQMQQEFSPYSCVSYYRVKLRVQLINTATSKVIATRIFSVVVTAPYANPYGGVLAANRAVATLLTQITRFCLHNT